MNNPPTIPVAAAVMALLVLIGLAGYIAGAILRRIERGDPRKEARYWQAWCWMLGLSTGALIPIVAVALAVRPRLPPADQSYCLIPLIPLLLFAGASLRASSLVVHEAGPYQKHKQVWRQQYVFVGVLLLTGVVVALLPLIAMVDTFTS